MPVDLLCWFAWLLVQSRGELICFCSWELTFSVFLISRHLVLEI